MEMVTFRRCTEPELRDVLAGLEGQTVSVVNRDGVFIGQAIVGPRIYSDTPSLDLHVDPDMRVIGA